MGGWWKDLAVWLKDENDEPFGVAHTDNAIHVAVKSVDIEQTTGATHSDENIAVAGKDENNKVRPIPLSNNSSGVSVAQMALQSLFESITGWTESAGADNLATTTTHRGMGQNFLTFDKINGDITSMISRAIPSTDVEAYCDGFGWMFVYLSTITDITKVFVRMGTDASNFHQWDFTTANLDLVDGWNHLSADIHIPTSQTGAGYNLAAITYIAFGAEFGNSTDTLAGIINGGWMMKRVLATTLEQTTTSETIVNSPNLVIRDYNSNTRADVLAGAAYNHLAVGLTDGVERASVNSSNQLETAEANSAAIKAAVEILDNIVSGNEAQVDIVTDLPKDRLVDNQGVALQTDAIMLDTTALTPAFAAISATTDNGNNTIVAASTGFQIRVLSLMLMSDADDTDVRFESGAGGTALTGRIPLKESTGFVLPFNPVGWFQTDTTDNELLNLEITGTGNVYGFLTYVYVPD